jgi:nitronate monooxygenase
MTLPAVLQNLSLPVIASPMFIASGPALVAAQCKAGIVGSFPALNARPAELLDVWLTDLQKELAEFQAANPDKRVGPIAVNQIVHQSNDRLAHDVEVCVKHQIPIIISSLRAPPKEMLDAIHSYGGIVLHDVVSIRHAEKALEAGVDGLILVASGAGGHAGTLSPFALVGEVRKFFKARSRCPAPSPPATPFWRRRPWARTLPTSARAGWRPRNPTSATATAKPSSNRPRPTSSTPTCSPACTAIT